MDPTATFLSAIRANREIEEALNIARGNSRGRIWLIGGAVYRSIVGPLYRQSLPVPDVDIVVEEMTSKLRLPPGWQKEKNSFGNYKLLKGAQEIDLIPLSTITYFLRKDIYPSMENFLSATPLNIQSLFYDLETKRVLGEVGINAILEKCVAVHNVEEAEYYCKLKKISLHDLIHDKARSLGFTPRYPP